jgi:hypothetical protein
VQDPPYTQELLLAIGRVAAASAELDETLRRVLSDLVETDGQADVIWVGQTTEWLVNSCKAMLTQRDPFQRRWTREERERFLGFVKRAGELRALRNWVIHGTFMTHRLADNDGDVQSRPWGAWDNEPSIVCLRHRSHSGMSERMFTVTDVNRIAGEILSLSQGWFDLWQELWTKDVELVPWEPPPVGRRWGLLIWALT